jgi:uncharacterized surface protein with fasciclin (FAS1) repeats
LLIKQLKHLIMKATQKLRRSLLLGAFGLTFISAMVSCKDDPAPTPPAAKNIVEVAQGNANLTILVSAVTKAGLANTLATTANLTVFAPTNDAFIAANYPQATIDALTADQLRDILTPLLTYHVLGLSKSVLAKDVPASDTVKTLNGKNIYASKNANGVFINGIKVSTADVAASNGVVHVIDGVLIPPTKTITQLVIDNPGLTLLKAAVVRAGLADALAGAGKFTVFAPTDDAFKATPYNTADIINGTDPAAVDAIVKPHALLTNVFASDLISGDTPASINLGAKELTIDAAAPSVKIKGAANASKITTANIIATNGVVHVVDKVLLP